MANERLSQFGDFLSAFAQGKQGSDVRQGRITRELLGGIQNLPQGQVLGSEQLRQLALVNPAEAKAISSPLEALDEQRHPAERSQPLARTRLNYDHSDLFGNLA